MVLDIAAILSAAGTGAVTGYLTNNLALKMIFKKYGPFGGVVLKTKEEFIASIAQLVERDIINHETLKEEFSREEFKRSLNGTVSDFLKRDLYQRSGDKELGELKAWEENYLKLSTYLAHRTPLLLRELVQVLDRKYSLDDFVSRDELKTKIADLYEYYLKETEENNIFKKIIINFYNEIKDKKLDELLSSERKEDIQNFLRELALALINEEELSPEKEEGLKSDLKSLINLDNLSEHIFAEMKKVKIDDIFKEEGQLNNYIEDETFSKNLKELILNFKIEMENSNLVIDDLISDELRSAINDDLELILASANSRIKEFLLENQEEVDEFIIEAVEAEIEASTGFKAMSRAGIYNKYRENIEEYGKPVDLITDYLDNNASQKRSDFRSKIADQLKNIELSHLSSYLNADLLTAQLKDMLISMLNQNRSASLLEIISEDIFSSSNFKDKIYDAFFEFVKRSLSDPELLNILINYTFELELNKIIGEKDLQKAAAEIESLIIGKLEGNNYSIEKMLDYINKNTFKLLDDYFENNSDSTAVQTNELFKMAKEDIAEKKMTEIYNFFQKNQDRVFSLTDFISKFLYSNLPELVEGRVAQAASANLYKLSDEEVQNAVEEFMGKELKPITYLGAFLGALAGLTFSMTGAESIIANTDPIWLEYAAAAVLYGGVGWLTNVLAIWMIFNPYQKKEIASFKIPFTPGVVAKNKGRFALSMGQFVESELLKAETAAELIEDNREQMTEGALSFCKGNNYKFIFNLLRDNRQLAAETLSELTFRDELINSNRFKKAVGQIDSALKATTKNKLSELDYLKNIEKYLEEYQNEKIFSETELAELIDMGSISRLISGNYELELSSARFKNIVNDKSLYPVIKYFLPYIFNKNLEFDIKKNALKLFRGNKNEILSFAEDWLISQEEQIARAVNFKKDELLEKEKEKKGGLLKNTLISGALYMADLDEFVDSVIQRIFNKQLPDFLEKKEESLLIELDSFSEELDKINFQSTESRIISNALSDFMNSPKGKNMINEIIYLSEDSIEDLLSKLLREDDKNLFKLKFNLESEQIIDFISSQLSLEEKLSLLIKLKSIVTEDNIKKELIQLLKSSDFSNINRLINKFITEVDLNELELISEDFREQFLQNIQNVIEDKEIKNKLIKILAEEIIRTADFMEDELETATLEEVLELFIESGIDSFKRNSEGMLNSLKLKELTAEEVEEMDPAEIEEVFDSFAGKYFTHLKAYGWFGGIFGLLQLLIRSAL